MSNIMVRHGEPLAVPGGVARLACNAATTSLSDIGADRSACGARRSFLAETQALNLEVMTGAWPEMPTRPLAPMGERLHVGRLDLQEPREMNEPGAAHAT